ncbi:hypothetical protein GCM10010978_17520 [Compostibacillus humi]|uniref:N-acetyltransferase domain-containing protein n=1 Tax=Compostibacillus humi TaxID=1245525 RepID=A0A8J2TNF3_9BACI|nr:GNAT family N-acetyltransferase [Compostibacillus humi]GFZ76336.1 hypothetical protein GCM10010978_17520 [Compostibacillus humi]
MIRIIEATEKHVQGISDVCTIANWTTYKDIYSTRYIEKVIKEFYQPDRILKEVTVKDRSWGGYFVAVENDEVLGAAGGGMISEKAGEIYVLYIHPSRRNEGIGTKLFEAVTNQQKEQFHAAEQWVSVAKGNERGIPFYEAKGFQFQYEEIDEGSTEEEKYISLRYYRKI